MKNIVKNALIFCSLCPIRPSHALQVGHRLMAKKNGAIGATRGLDVWHELDILAGPEDHLSHVVERRGRILKL